MFRDFKFHCPPLYLHLNIGTILIGNNLSHFLQFGLFAVWFTEVSCAFLVQRIRCLFSAFEGILFGFHVWISRWRSEEHTSELQSRFDLVCRLLLVKKKYLSFLFKYIHT